MTENCPYYEQGKCALSPTDSQYDCTWPLPAYDTCNVYVMNAVAAHGGSMEDQLRTIGALEHGAEVTGGRDRTGTASMDLKPDPPPVSSPPSAAGEDIQVGGLTKHCPTCGEKLEAAAEACPSCGARFDVYIQAYCTHCHKLIQTSVNGKCPDCQGSDLLDLRPYSSLTAPGIPPITPAVDLAPEVPTAITGSALAAPPGTETPATVETKKCPRCAETIKAEARLCRFCGAQFEVTRRGYCSTDHAMVDVDDYDKCKKCGSPVLDVRTESRPISDDIPAVETREPVSGEVVEWVIEPIRGEGVSWRFNGVFVDVILINIAYSLVALGVSLSTYLATGVDVASFADIYWGATVVFLPVIWFLYFFLFETISGATPGKRGSNLKVIRKDGGKIVWWQAAVRAFFSFFEYNIIGAIFVWSTPLKQRIGNLIAGTLVVNRDRIYRVEFRPDLSAFDFHDYRHVEFAKITAGIVHKFGLARQITLNGVSPQGVPLTAHWNAQFQRAEVERIRHEIERRYGIAFSEKIILWRLIVGIFALVALCGLLALVLAMLNR